MFRTKRRPTHPGEILKEDFMDPLGLTQSALAERLGTSFRTVNELVNEKRSVSPDMALRLARLFGTSEELWLNLQNAHDLYRAYEKKGKSIASIRPIRRKVAA